MKKGLVNRRGFIRTAGLGLSFPAIVPSWVRGQAPPSERITMAAIGMGPRCLSVIQHFFTFPEVQFLAVCDVRQERLEAAKRLVDSQYQGSDCIAYRDFRELFANEKIDAVLIATGDRWHSLLSIAAAQAGKDVYSEKPMSLTIEEGRAVAKAMKRYGTVYQCGHQRRSVDSYRFQNEVVRSGKIGRVHTVIARNWQNAIIKPEAPAPVPPGLDYDMWLGPTPYHEFVPARFRGWNDFWDTGGGSMIGMGVHYTDLAQWGLETDDTGPVRFEGWAKYSAENFADTPQTAEVQCTYADGRRLVLKSEDLFANRFIRFVGTEGWIQVDDETDLITAEPASLLRTRGVTARGWSQAGDHVGNFLQCIKSRRETTCPPESSHRATTICHIANICCRLGRSLTWDPRMERFVNDPEADRMVSRAMRAPWRL